MENELATQTAPWTKRKRLACFFRIRARGISPTLRPKLKWRVEILRVVGYGPGTGVDFGPSRNICSVNHCSGRDSRESLRTRRVHSEAFIDDCLHIRELLSRGCIDFGVGLVARANLVTKFVVSGGGGEEVECYSGEEGVDGFAAGDAVEISTVRDFGVDVLAYIKVEA